ncbi:hypothetical protein [Streptomyces sp. NPDC060031]|uniref:hypothetical protein n=1 Tax=Streptomyces sp. NPDC060031 TaxID=3347043 RepID=UPI0036755F1E
MISLWGRGGAALGLAGGEVVVTVLPPRWKWMLGCRLSGSHPKPPGVEGAGGQVWCAAGRFDGDHAGAGGDLECGGAAGVVARVCADSGADVHIGGSAVRLPDEASLQGAPDMELRPVGLAVAFRA